MKRYVLPILLVIILIGSFIAGCHKPTATQFTVDNASCNGCGRCIEKCPNNAIEVDTDGNAIIDNQKCIQCGKCVRVCPQHAIY